MSFPRSSTCLVAIVALILPRVARADPPPALAPTPSQAGAPAVASGLRARTVFVHIDGGPGMRLESRTADGDEDAWILSCEAPCDLNLSTQLEYRVSAKGTGKHPSDPFSLKAIPGQREVIALSVDSHAPAGGIALLSTGIVVAATGFVTAMGELFYSVTCSPPSDGGSGTATCGSRTPVYEGAGVAMAIGGVLVVVGALVIASSHYVHQTQTIADLFLPIPAGLDAAAWPPAPAWRAPVGLTAPCSPIFAIPFLSRSF
jgi:hypothetical protein